MAGQGWAASWNGWGVGCGLGGVCSCGEGLREETGRKLRPRVQVGGSLDNSWSHEPSGMTPPAGLSSPGDMVRCTDGQAGRHTHPLPLATNTEIAHIGKRREKSRLLGLHC